MERTKLPPNEPPSEEDVREFERKFDEFFGMLSESEKLLAASLRVVAAEEDRVNEAQSAGEGHEAALLSDKEIQEFVSKLDSFHDGLPEGQHQILDTLAATAFVHSLPEEERDDVRGNVWLWKRWIYPGDTQTRNYYRDYCYRQRGKPYYTASQYVSGVGTYWQIGCWR